MIVDSENTSEVPEAGSEVGCDFLGLRYRLRSYGLMSYRQYFVSREDAFMEQVVRCGWRRLAYCGASYGLQPLALSKHGPVYALEPVHCIFEALCENIRLNTGTGIVPLRLGLHSREGFLEITHGGHGGPTPSLCCAKAAGQYSDVSQFVSFSSDIMSLFDAAVVDIEGHEFDVVTMGPGVPPGVSNLFMELHRDILGEVRADEVVRRLGEQGFQPIKISSRHGQDHVWFCRKDKSGSRRT